MNSLNEPETFPEESERGGSSTRARVDTIERRKAELALDKAIFESLTSIVEQNIENDYFYNEYRRLRQNLIDETLACNEVLNARTQQSTWQLPRNRRLAFWLR